jgi:polyhydroxybutyrate depolymerase
MAAPDRHAAVIDETVSLYVGGFDRTMILVRPRHLEPGAPVVLVFHGSNQSAARVRSFAGGSFDAFAERGAVVAYLEGYRGHWNDARVSSDFTARSEGVDDVAFTEAALGLLSARFAVDLGRVFAVGYSNGGQLVIRLAHEIASRLAGLALISATQPAPQNFRAREAASIPLATVLFHGTKDPIAPYEGGMSSLWGFHPRGLGLSAPQTAEYYARRNGITAAPRTEHLPGRGGATSIERTDYREPGHPPVTLFTIHGGGHVIPGGRSRGILGRGTDRLVAADAIAEFFGLA